MNDNPALADPDQHRSAHPAGADRTAPPAVQAPSLRTPRLRPRAAVGRRPHRRV